MTDIEGDLLTQADDAEAEAVRLEERAAAARRRLDALRSRENVARSKSQPSHDEDAAPRRTRRQWIGRVAGIAGLFVVAGIVTAALIADGRMWSQHQQANTDQRRSAEFTAAARQSVVNLTSLDFNHAPADVQRIIDGATGAFKDDFQRAADDFTKTAEMSKVVTVGTVNGVAVESMTDDSAVVLVAATSQITNAAGARENPRAWRLSVTVTRDAGVLKMSKVEMVP